MPICKQNIKQRKTPKNYQPQNCSLLTIRFTQRCRQIKSRMRSLFRTIIHFRRNVSSIICQQLAKWEKRKLTSLSSLFSCSVDLMKESDSRCEGVDRTTHMGLNMGKSVIDDTAYPFCCRFLFVVFFDQSFLLCLSLSLE